MKNLETIIEGTIVHILNITPKETVSKEENIEASNKEMMHEVEKDSKKRKRPISEENGQQVADEETKRQKIENLNESKEQTNGNLEKGGEKSSVQGSLKKQQKGSVEVCCNCN